MRAEDQHSLDNIRVQTGTVAEMDDPIHLPRHSYGGAVATRAARSPTAVSSAAKVGVIEVVSLADAVGAGTRQTAAEASSDACCGIPPAIPVS
jgi:hypothetical protein